MRTSRFSVLTFIMATLALAAACAEKRHSDEADDHRTPAATAKKETSPPPAIPETPNVPGTRALYNFDSDAAGKPPAHFSFARTGQGSEGAWVVKEEATAPSKPNVLAQTSTDGTDYRFPLAILEESGYQNVVVSVKFKAVAGKVDQAGGIIFRVQDPNNYYLVRANALEDNYRLYHVVAGKRREFAGSNFRVTPNAWHKLRVEIAGNQIKCYYDDQLKITATDDTFKGPGKVGLWTKADSVTYFDDLEISAQQ